MKTVSKFFALFFILCAASSFVVTDADARGRRGSHRVGGYSSHGKGSHYIGGHTSIDFTSPYQVATDCNDGSQSNSTGSGTCSHHGGERK